ncbi:hypothetical protein NUSPORA_00606 [Nucleospora cyclopteri]
MKLKKLRAKYFLGQTFVFPPCNINIATFFTPMSSLPQKNAGKAPVKSISTAPTTRKVKRKAVDPSTGLMFKSAIKKCLKESIPDGSITITRNSLSILCGIAMSILEDVATLSSELAQKVNKKTIGGEEITTAFELMLTGELKKLCVREIKNTLSKMHTKKAK